MKNLIIGEKYKEKLEIPLKKHGFDPIWLENNPNIDPKLSSHVDLSVFKDDKKLILAPYLKEKSLVSFLTSGGFSIVFSEACQTSFYPGDINLCALSLGDTLIHNLKYTDARINEIHFERQINVNQGYTRCTALSIKDSIITSDAGIAKIASEAGIEVLIIPEGGISLDGYSYGFIGGAAFTAEDTVYFTGDISRHNACPSIVDFIESHAMKICCLTEDPLFDIGGAVYLE